MKTIYLIKSFLPFIFLPIAPGVVQVELERQGFLTHGSGAAYLTLALQVLFTLAAISWLVLSANRKRQTKDKEFLKMSCVSKKVFHLGQWMSVEQYLADYHNIVVSHGMTPEESKTWLEESEEYLREELKATSGTVQNMAMAK